MGKTFNQRDVQNVFDGFKDYTSEDAEKVLGSKDRIFRMVSGGALAKYLDDVKVFFQMLRDVFARRYNRVPKGTIAAILGTLLYVLNPADLIPDVIPVVGLLDDAAMLALCLKFVSHDVEEYKRVMGVK